MHKKRVRNFTKSYSSVRKNRTIAVKGAHACMYVRELGNAQQCSGAHAANDSALANTPTDRPTFVSYRTKSQQTCICVLFFCFNYSYMRHWRLRIAREPLLYRGLQLVHRDAASASCRFKVLLFYRIDATSVERRAASYLTNRQFWIILRE